jgi:3-phenylpropionate/trans-cinnamate dioxygenase ferredoxin reductase subunit
MAGSRVFVVVGGGLAGGKTVEALRDQGFDGRIVLYAKEQHRPYERPPLSKGYLLGDAERDSVHVHPEDWYAEHDVELRTGVAVTAVDTAQHLVSDSDGGSERYDALLIATGAVPRRLSVPGGDLAGIRYLRTLEDSDRLKASFVPDARVAIIGGGWIGLETAAAARHAGASVTVLEGAELPLLRVLGPEIARVFAQLHLDHGVDLRTRVTVEALEPAADEPGRVGAVRLGDGERVPADVVVVGVGILPDVELAEGAGLHVDNGIVVDAHLRTSVPDVYAAGDVANADHPLLGRPVRVEHWANALHQPEVAAASMLGIESVYDRLPYFFTDQYDVGMEYVGDVGPGGYDEVVTRGDVAKREFVAFWLREGRVLAGMNVNVWDVVDDVLAVIRSGKVVDRARLADPDVPLTDLA